MTVHRATSSALGDVLRLRRARHVGSQIMPAGAALAFGAVLLAVGKERTAFEMFVGLLFVSYVVVFGAAWRMDIRVGREIAAQVEERRRRRAGTPRPSDEGQGL